MLNNDAKDFTDEGATELLLAVMRTLEKVVQLAPGLRQWRCIVEEYAGNDLLMSLDVSPKVGEGDNCALAKIAALKTYPSITNTGELKASAYDLEAAHPELVSWYGGIRAGFTDYLRDSVSKDGKPCGLAGDDGYILVAFSGAREDFDTFVSVAVLLALETTYAELNPLVFSSMDWEPLEADRVSGFALNMLRQSPHLWR
ncbi:MAG: hypothetical protein LBL84_02765 [Candidatus Nomurabacteria bacterium]|jgi:hypothetical protein|nr:hypothetical protein [Candidatus Nomurabacteria bacterium]